MIGKTVGKIVEKPSARSTGRRLVSRLALSAFGLALAGAAMAATTLPLEPGLYLPADVRCGNEQAETEVFRIDARGISTNRMACTVQPAAGRANTFEATCREGEDVGETATPGDGPTVKRVIRVLSRRTLTLDGENFRFCQVLDD
ncbi:hypothetical protein [Phreatobacter stygius]|uniref:DUF3617 family protein n=1 Tax=Phreatobacter stygius TaxID=1940610 RepID=A0A4D7B0P1_9HYPH|nr:hypothetical protein [Phreatobacter stygius]QCI67214.1 hypothetical protein E8M01_25065 [Phreatobacter stygius]